MARDSVQPRLTSQLKPGGCIVSHRYRIGDRVPERTAAFSVRGTHISLWRMS